MHHRKHTTPLNLLLILIFIPFTLFTMNKPVCAGTAILSWDPPTTNTDGTPLTDLAGYKVYYGTTSGNYSSTIDTGNVTTYTVSNLPEKTTYYFAVTAYDTSGNESGYSNEVYKTIPDTTPPVISGITTSSITSTGAVITWITDEPSTSQVEYGTTTSYGSSTTIDNNLVTSHSVTLSGLSPWTTYHFRVKSHDDAGNPATSADLTFTTLAPPDTTPPTLSIIKAENITDSTATISWTTDEASTSQVEYGTTAGYGSATQIDTNPVTNHSASLTGLSPSTTYHFRVKSQDGAGNLAISSDYTFITLKPPQPDTPAAITDLRIRGGASTRNTVVLDWTATGADGTEGTASMYDLRMSILKIIEDGVIPARGEINFSDATRITGIPSPKPAGTAESLQIDNLETNSVYYFAIKAIDDKGNRSAISNVINGDNLPPIPVTAVRQGYTMISLPLTPVTSDVQTLLRLILGGPVELYWWSSNGPDLDGVFVLGKNIVPGYGYFLKSDMNNSVLNISGTAITDASITIPLQPGWNLIGNPYPEEVALRNTYIRKIETGEVKSFEDAVIAGWVGNAIYNYNGSTYNLELYTDAILKLWQGYWLAVFQKGQYEMIVYRP